jgi:hypothetical protein
MIIPRKCSVLDAQQSALKCGTNPRIPKKSGARPTPPKKCAPSAFPLPQVLSFDKVFANYPPPKANQAKETVMISKVSTLVAAAALVTYAGIASAQVGVGGNGVPSYPTTAASKNHKVTNHGVGGNAEPKYSAMPASKNQKVTNHGVGGNAEPKYPATTKQ